MFLFLTSNNSLHVKEHSGQNLRADLVLFGSFWCIFRCFRGRRPGRYRCSVLLNLHISECSRRNDLGIRPVGPWPTTLAMSAEAYHAGQLQQWHPPAGFWIRRSKTRNADLPSPCCCLAGKSAMCDIAPCRVARLIRRMTTEVVNCVIAVRKSLLRKTTLLLDADER